MPVPPLPPINSATAPEAGSKETLVAHTLKYEIATRRHGAWLIVILRGNYADDMLEFLKKEILSQKVSFAIEASMLSGISMLLARELWFHAGQLKNTDYRLVLLNPQEKMRSLFTLISPGAKLTTFQGEEELPVDGKNLEQHMKRVESEMAELRKHLSTNALWQFIDRETCWLCPFCGKLQADIKVASRVSIPQATIERVYRHIHHRCPGYSPVTAKFLPSATLDQTIKSINDEKFSASKQHAQTLEKKVEVLGAKAQWADSMEAGLKIAVDRQKRLLPARPPEIPGFEVAIVYHPASHVSGDFYDFIDMGRGRTGFSIGDVAGHGIEAGILMGMTKKVINIRASDCDDPVEVMRKANGDIYKELDRQTFVTAFLGMLDPETKKFVYARAGHNPPLIFNKKRTPPHGKLETGGLMLGMSVGTIFDRAMTGETVDLQPGDVILLYTDGLEEAKNDKGDLFGTQRMAEVVEKEGERPAKFILGALSFELDRFVGTGIPEDDVTAVCIKCL